MRVTRKKRDERPLAEFPGWGLEIMMGLYGEQQVRDALAAECADDAPRQPVSDVATAAEHATQVGSTEATEFEAVTSMLARVRRLRRR
ncbi:hypothetical protein OG579_06310 [Williamsia herbipolensis]|uniref:Uncharacterized protein n=1 Tax=Williamsia herbipolensis TaxID=1603258 RepID=A0AAU4K5Q9_9NOCA|nr:hypothetical protein [Williamsia herbipolensis]